MTEQELLETLESRGWGTGAGYDLRSGRDASLARAIHQVVILPDGVMAERRTKIVARYAVAVHVPNDEITAAHWEVFRWVVKEHDLAETIARAAEIYRETQTLEVDTDE